MEYERQTLGWGERIEHDEECKTDRVGQQRFLLRLELPVSADHRIGQVCLEGFLAPNIARS